MDSSRTLRRCARGHMMKAHWVECEICGVKVDRTPRALDMNPAPQGPTMVSLSLGVPTQEVSPTAPHPLVGVLVVPERDEIHKVRAGDNAVGSGETSDILIEGKFISASHAILTWRAGEGFTITDQNSTNGTFLNDQRVTRAKVEDGDRVRLGNVPAIFKSIL